MVIDKLARSGMRLRCSFFARGVKYHQYNRHEEYDKAAKRHKLFVGILLILIGLCQQLFAFAQVDVGLLHLLQAELYFFALSVDHDAGLGGNILDLIDEPLDLQQLFLLLCQYLVSNGVFVRCQKLTCQLFFIDCSHLHQVFCLKMFSPFGFHVVKLLLELGWVISFDELFVHLFDAAAQFRIFVDFGKGHLQFIVIIIFLLILRHEDSDSFQIGLRLYFSSKTLQLIDRSLDRPAQFFEMAIFLLHRGCALQLDQSCSILSLSLNGQHLQVKKISQAQHLD